LAKDLGKKLVDINKEHPSHPEVIVDIHSMTKNMFIERLPLLHTMVQGSSQHITCPIIYEGCSTTSLSYVGGFGEFCDLVEKRHDVSCYM
jgi:hypothetical protein